MFGKEIKTKIAQALRKLKKWKQHKLHICRGKGAITTTPKLGYLCSGRRQQPHNQFMFREETKKMF
jgi:hypothetical protein